MSIIPETMSVADVCDWFESPYSVYLRVIIAEKDSIERDVKDKNINTISY